MHRDTEPTTLWEPSPERIAASRLTAYMRWLRENRGLEFESYDELWRWSVTDLEEFWKSIADYFGVRWGDSPQQVLGDRRMPGAEWFRGGTLNWAEHALQGDLEATAIVYRSETGERVEWSYRELRDQVARIRAGLIRLGVGRGDRVAAFLANTPEAVAALLACASLGAVWSSCPPEFGVPAVLDRFRQIEPRVLLAHSDYFHNGRLFDRSSAVDEIRSGLTGLEATVVLERFGNAVSGALAWEAFTSDSTALEFESVPFSHPLWILYSSGTTGLPKAIVQGHGGILFEHLKQLALHCDLGPRDRFFWYSTTGWMMWNYLVSGLLLGATVVLYEGGPAHPDLSALFRLAEEEGITYFGTSAPFLIECRKAGLQPGRELGLGALRALGSTGAPLPEEGFEWVYQAVKADLALGSISGGSDVCTAFVGSCPLLPVRSGELQCKGLGTAAHAFNEDGKPVLDELGELVITEPMPSMPLFFWGDPDGKRYRESYFETYPGVWRHGDWIRFDAAGRSVIYGRSDSTLNRGGVRMGTSDFYRVVDTLPEVADSLVIETGTLGNPGKLWLFVVLAAGQELDESLVRRIRTALRGALSPRHVPDEIRAVPAVPKTLSGKKLEVPIRKILTGVPQEKALQQGTLANPESLAPLLASTRDGAGNESTG
jgi:acetoacetyl-CoA synthetase